MQDQLSIQNVVNHINNIKKCIYYIIPIDQKKYLWKSIYGKNFQQIRNRGESQCGKKKGIYKKFTCRPT